MAQAIEHWLSEDAQRQLAAAAAGASLRTVGIREIRAIHPLLLPERKPVRNFAASRVKRGASAATRFDLFR
jgi:hypothetical protein